MIHLPNKYTNEFVGEFDKNDNPIFYLDECEYRNNLGAIIKMHYIGNDEYILSNSTDNIKYKLSSLSGRPTTSDLINIDTDKDAVYILCVFDSNSDELIGIINASHNFNMIYILYNELEDNEDIMNEIPINKIFINKKIYKIYANLGSY